MTKTGTELVDPLHPVTTAFLNNPYPIYAALRSEAPIFYCKKGKYWVVTSYQLANEITKDLRFGKRLERWKHISPIARILPGTAHLIKTRANWMLNENPPTHTHLRSLVNKAFSPKIIQQMREHVQRIADRFIDKALPNGKMEFISEFAFLLPITVIAEMLGIPGEDHEKFKDWSHEMTQTLEPGYSISTLNKANKANDDLMNYFKPLVEERRKNPKSDLISALVMAEENGDSLSEADILGNLVLMLVAGHETTVNLIGNGLLWLLKSPEQLALLRANPENMETAVEEMLRYDSPVQTVKRIIEEDMEYHGKQLKKGDMVVIYIGACNRDPAIFPDPDRFDITRKENKHLAFSSGIHHCLGASLARMEGQIAISTMLNRLPNLRLAEQEFEYKRPFNLRGVKEMHLLF